MSSSSDGVGVTAVALDEFIGKFLAVELLSSVASSSWSQGPRGVLSCGCGDSGGRGGELCDGGFPTDVARVDVGVGTGTSVGAVVWRGSRFGVSQVPGSREKSQRTTVNTPSSAVVRSSGEWADCDFLADANKNVEGHFNAVSKKKKGRCN